MADIQGAIEIAVSAHKGLERYHRAWLRLSGIYE